MNPFLEMLLGQQGSSGAPLAPPQEEIDPTAMLLQKALASRDTALEDYRNADVEPEKIKVWQRIVGGLGGAAAAYGAGLQGRPAPESPVELLRRRREMAARQEEDRLRQRAALDLSVANADIGHLRGEQGAKEREARQEAAEEGRFRRRLDADQKRSDRESLEGLRNTLASIGGTALDTDTPEVLRRKIAARTEENELREHRQNMESIRARFNDGKATKADEIAMERDAQATAALLDLLDGLEDPETGVMKKLTPAQYDAKLRAAERTLRVLGVPKDSKEFRARMLEFQRELDPYWQDPGGARGSVVGSGWIPARGVGEAAAWFAGTPMAPVASSVPWDDVLRVLQAPPRGATRR